MENNFTGYYIYDNLIKDGYINIYTDEITKDNIYYHYHGILNIIKDYIDQDIMKHPCVIVHFDKKDQNNIILGLVDYWFNIIMWELIILPSQKQLPPVKIKANDLFYPEKGITKSYVKNYIDTKFIDKYRTILSNVDMNNILDDCLYKFLVVDEFSMFLANSINLEQCFIEPMNEDKEFYDIVNLDLSEVELENAKVEADQGINNLVNKIMKNKNNPLYDYFIASEGIRKNQLREVAISIAQKPDGHGGIYPIKIQTSLINGGVQDLVYYFIESSTGRTAQIILNNNVGNSGHLARLLGLNNMDTRLHPDPHYSCNTQNLVELVIPNEYELKRYLGRYYRFELRGREYKIDVNSTHIIGKKILLRSPMTCASRESQGICYKCYGDLAHTNKDINIGKYAAEATSSEITQKMLSAKHLLEANIKPFNWNEGFKTFFEIDNGMVILKPEYTSEDLNGYSFIISPEIIFFETEDEDGMYNKYTDCFDIENPVGERIPITSESMAMMFFTEDFNKIIEGYVKQLDEDDESPEVKIPLSSLINTSLFLVNIVNSDISLSLTKFKNIINRKGVTTSYDNVSSILESMSSVLKDIGINLNSVHVEIILANQIRAKDDILEVVDWEYIDAPYEIITLDNALRYNQSITKSLSYQDTGNMLVDPITYQKNKPSVMDLFFMKQPQEYLNDDLVKR